MANFSLVFWLVMKLQVLDKHELKIGDFYNFYFLKFDTKISLVDVVNGYPYFYPSFTILKSLNPPS